MQLEPPAERLTEQLTSPRGVTSAEIAAWVIVGGGLIFVLVEHLVAGVVTTLTLYLILNYFAGLVEKKVPGKVARPLAFVIVTLIAGAIITGAFAFLIAFIRGHTGNLPALMKKMAEILESTRIWLIGLGGIGYALPDIEGDAEDLKMVIVGWLKENAEVVRSAGGFFSRGVIHVVMGALLAVLLFFRRRLTDEQKAARGALARNLAQKIMRFALSFNQIVTAQVKISAINTLLTAAYIWLILPLAGRPLPFALTIVVLTFLCGLIPILGNLVSNTVIVIISLGISIPTAVASLVFLVVIHKLEYLVNSKIVGVQTDSQAWEILMAILIGEAAFGLGGVVLAPIAYAFLKRELREYLLV